MVSEPGNKEGVEGGNLLGSAQAFEPWWGPNFGLRGFRIGYVEISATQWPRLYLRASI